MIRIDNFLLRIIPLYFAMIRRLQELLSAYNSKTVAEVDVIEYLRSNNALFKDEYAVILLLKSNLRVLNFNYVFDPITLLKSNIPDIKLHTLFRNTYKVNTNRSLDEYNNSMLHLIALYRPTKIISYTDIFKNLIGLNSDMNTVLDILLVSGIDNKVITPMRNKGYREYKNTDPYSEESIKLFADVVQEQIDYLYNECQYFEYFELRWD